MSKSDSETALCVLLEGKGIRPAPIPIKPYDGIGKSISEGRKSIINPTSTPKNAKGITPTPSPTKR
ncbi:TPA: hypothetical protein RZD79_000423 [Mannheimia haemolytica]|nr:hypothetical protein [Mannheimia haemolytica]HDL5235637.1 hypothetical protein [Mannheimia haemolytica]HDL5365018.1 hypothetical protein [Mannheimia haemolytica]HDZ3572423.1 hypothetical protein [Mannheimia haemolytica]HDZ6829868.1 hypothetical protein [Mannheimia haemolytica]